MNELEKLLKSAKARKNKKLLQDIGDVLRIYEKKHAKQINKRGQMATKAKKMGLLKKMR